MPVFGGGQTKFQPVYVGNVAQAVEIASRVDDPEALSSTNGKVFEAGGPESMCFITSLNKYPEFQLTS